LHEEEKKAMRKKLRKGSRVVPIAHRLVMGWLDEIDDFKDFMKSAIIREKDLTSERLEKGASGLEGEELEQYCDYYAEDYQKVGSVFEKLALDSFVVMLYSRVETGMATLCDASRQDRQKEKGETIGLRYSDLKGGGYLDQAKLYMEKVLGVDLDLGNNPQWPEIRGLQTLRNAIVHEEGWLRTKDGALKKHIKKGFIELKQRKDEKDEVSGSVIVSSEYVDYISAQIRTFFKNIKF
jgi:hypothetical protein